MKVIGRYCNYKEFDVTYICVIIGSSQHAILYTYHQKDFCFSNISSITSYSYSTNHIIIIAV